MGSDSESRKPAAPDSIDQKVRYIIDIHDEDLARIERLVVLTERHSAALAGVAVAAAAVRCRSPESDVASSTLYQAAMMAYRDVAEKNARMAAEWDALGRRCREYQDRLDRMLRRGPKPDLDGPKPEV